MSTQLLPFLKVFALALAISAAVRVAIVLLGLFPEANPVGATDLIPMCIVAAALAACFTRKERT